MQRPRIAPAIESRRNLNIIETRAHVRNHPKNKKQPHPWRAHHHGGILTREPQRNHTKEIQHPVYQKRAMAVRNRVPVGDVSNLGFARDRIGVCEVDLKGHGDEGVGERQHEVGAHCGKPAPDNHLPELERGVALWVDIGHVNGEVEGEAEEGYDDQVWVNVSVAAHQR